MVVAQIMVFTSPYRLNFSSTDCLIVATPANPRGHEPTDSDMDLTALAVERVINERLLEVKNILDAYFDDHQTTGGLRKRAIRLLRLGK